ncbi:MAG: hypothetical protein AAGA16_12240 [Cyanobacteria bacterium P01_E01_bin.35]
MNAFEQIKSLEAIGKIEAIVHLFRTEFPEVLADLKPWVKSNEAKQFSDPDSIDISFHFPNASFSCRYASFSCRCRTILMQIKLNREKDRVMSIKLSGYGAYQEQWQFSTLEYWEFSGISIPALETQMLLMKVCHQILELFNN